MSSNDVLRASRQVVDALADPWSDEEWDEVVAESRQDAERSHWGRFLRLFGEEGDPRLDGELSDEQLLARLADVEALTTQLMAVQARDLRLLRQRRLVEQATARPEGHDPGTCTRGCCDGDGWVGLEVAAALALSERQVERRLEAADRLERYGAVAAVVGQGLLQSWTATRLLEHLDTLAAHVTPDVLAVVEQGTVGWLTQRPRTVGQLNARMRRLLLQVRAGDGTDDAALTAEQRSVRVLPADTSGLATLVARLPEVDAVAIAQTLRALAGLPVEPTDSRSGQQRQCDLLITSLTGRQAGYGCAGDVDLVVRPPTSFGVRLDVTVPVTTLTGGDAPAQVPGHGSVPAWVARALTAMAGDDVTVRPLVYDPRTGHLLAAAERHHRPETRPRIRWLDQVPSSPAYDHPPVMERMLQLRDGTCRAPGCTRPATACDCDHVVPYPQGQTSLSNSCCLCRRHHRLKTHAPGWSLTLLDDGTAHWGTPTGRTLITDPADYTEPAHTLATPPATRPDADVPPF